MRRLLRGAAASGFLGDVSLDANVRFVARFVDFVVGTVVALAEDEFWDRSTEVSSSKSETIRDDFLLASTAAGREDAEGEPELSVSAAVVALVLRERKGVVENDCTGAALVFLSATSAVAVDAAAFVAGAWNRVGGGGVSSNVVRAAARLRRFEGAFTSSVAGLVAAMVFFCARARLVGSVVASFSLATATAATFALSFLISAVSLRSSAACSYAVASRAATSCLALSRSWRSCAMVSASLLSLVPADFVVGSVVAADVK